VLWLILGPFVLLGLFLGIIADGGESGAGFAIVLVIAPFLVAWEWLVRWTHLELSEQGLRLRQLGMTLETTWSNIEDIRLDPGREGFVTVEPLEGRGATRLARLRGAGFYGGSMYSPTQQEFMARRRWVPIEPFARYHLRHGTLARNLARFAPDLARDLPST